MAGDAYDTVPDLRAELAKLDAAYVRAIDRYHDAEGEVGELEHLLDLAGAVASWGNQMYHHFKDTPGGKHFKPRYNRYILARTRYFASRRPLNHNDYGGCVGCKAVTDGHWEILDYCSYHLAAKLQPWNHHIPWACGNYWDGCNCEGGPFYDPPPGTFDDHG
jgi:hypothetical protein